MQSTHAKVNALSALATGNGNDATPFSQQSVVLTKQASIARTWQAKYWRAQHEQSLKREAALKAQVEAREATVRDLTQRLYGTKSEKSVGPDQAGRSKPPSARPRGQQLGSQGHGRRARSALPVVAEVHDVSAAAQHCPACGEAFAPFPGAEESHSLAVQIQPPLRRIQRPRDHKTCGCPHVQGIVTAPPAPRVIPKSPLGVSVWTRMLLDQYLYGRPTHRLCEELRHDGLPLAQGTCTDGLQRIAVLVEPLRPALYERQMGAKRFHGDETRWEVFEEGAGKTGHRGYLWVMPSASVVLYRMAPGRGADVPKAHCAKRPHDLVEVVWVCDRSRASQCLAKDGDARLLALCWAHVRRDVLKAARRWLECENWMCAWVDDIGVLSRLKKARLEVWDETVPFTQPPSAFVERPRELEAQRSQRQARCEAPRPEPALPLAQHKVLRSLHNHGAGLTVFVGRPEVAMANNTAERILRNPVVGRKNSDGSGSVWSAHLAAMRFRVIHTVWLWGLNPPHWLHAFLQACADHGGQSPTDLSAFLPWQMTPERREALARPVPVTCPPLTGPAQQREASEAADTS
jgi:transposase